MNKKRMIYLVVIIGVVSFAYVGWKLTARTAYESPDYTVMESDGPMEIRRYDDLMMATTDMQFASQGDDGSFMRLFKYISGANDKEQKVAMTTPVFMERENAETQGRMGFVIPEQVALTQIPKPSHGQVQIQKRVGGRFAVIRFNGFMDSESAAKAETELRQWMNEKGLVPASDPDFAGYDPPWTPAPFRRNEVLIRLN